MNSTMKLSIILVFFIGWMAYTEKAKGFPKGTYTCHTTYYHFTKDSIYIGEKNVEEFGYKCDTITQNKIVCHNDIDTITIKYKMIDNNNIIIFDEKGKKYKFTKH